MNMVSSYSYKKMLCFLDAMITNLVPRARVSLHQRSFPYRWARGRGLYNGSRLNDNINIFWLTWCSPYSWVSHTTLNSSLCGKKRFVTTVTRVTAVKKTWLMPIHILLCRKSSGIQLHGYAIKGKFDSCTDEARCAETRGEENSETSVFKRTVLPATR